MEKLKVSELTPHPRNGEFFDDISGVKWDEFLKSVKERGVIEPVIITQDKVIVSGHHRVKACKTLGIEDVLCEVRIYENEDDVLQDLIETNIRQRGNVGGSEMKAAARIHELERIYDIRRGGDRKSKVHNAPLKTQSQLAEESGMSIDEWKRYKKLSAAIPELSQAVENGKVTKTTALAMMKQLTEEEQKELLESSAEVEKITQAKVTEYKTKLDIANAELSTTKNELRAAQNRPVKEVVKEVIPQDYEDKLKAAQYDAQRATADYDKARKENAQYRKENEALKAQLGADKVIKEADRDVITFTQATLDYIRIYGGHVWAFNEMENISEGTRKDFFKAIQTLDVFAQQLIANMGGVIDE